MERGHAFADLGELAERVRPAGLARDRRLPVLDPLTTLVPGGGLRRGTTVAVAAEPGATGATSLALALAAGPSQAGSWVAAVGFGAAGSLGLVAAAGMGVSLERLVLLGADPARNGPNLPQESDVTARGRDRRAGRTVMEWERVIAALVDGFDVVLVGGGRWRASKVRRLVARVRERGAVLVTVGGELPGEPSPLRLTVTAGAWQGLGEGWGYLRARRVLVTATGRGEASRPRSAELWLPSPSGEVAPVDPTQDTADDIRSSRRLQVVRTCA